MKPMNPVIPNRTTLRHPALVLALCAGLGASIAQAQTPTPPPVTSGMVVWLPADGVNTSDTNQVRIVGADTFVKQWKDFSTAANKHASNPTEADQPRYIVGALNGKPVLRFGQDNDDNGDGLYLGDLSANFPSGASLFVVATIDNDSVTNGIEFFMGATGSSFTANPSLNAGNTITWPASAAYSGTYEVQTSPDLVNWTNVSPKPVPSGGTLSYSLLPSAPGGKSFVRLFVTPTP